MLVLRGSHIFILLVSKMQRTPQFTFDPTEGMRDLWVSVWWAPGVGVHLMKWEGKSCGGKLGNQAVGFVLHSNSRKTCR